MATAFDTEDVKLCNSNGNDFLNPSKEDEEVCKVKEARTDKTSPKKDGKVSIALVGETGSGKSSFLNAFFRKTPARTGVSTTEPECHIYPDNPKLSFCDLPGLGSKKYLDIETYCDQLKLEDGYDAFLLFTNARHELSARCQCLVQRLVSTKKPVFFIKTFMDIDEDHENDTKGGTLDEDNTFFISNVKPEEWDFPHLRNMLTEEICLLTPTTLARMNLESAGNLSTKKCDDGNTQEEEARINRNKNMRTGEKAIEHGESKAAMNLTTSDEAMAGKSSERSQSFINAITRTDKTSPQKDGKVSIALVGETGSGKSSFLNAFFRKTPARTGVSTTEPEYHIYPDNPKLSFCDLPGLGSTKYLDIETYCDQLKLEDGFDAFLLFTNARHGLSARCQCLEQRLVSTKKPVFFIKTFMDIDGDHENDTKGGTIDKNNTFFISNVKPEEWDFPCLRNTLTEEICLLTPTTQRSTERMNLELAHQSLEKKWKDMRMEKYDEESCRIFYNMDISAEKETIEHGGLQAAMRLMKEPRDYKTNVAIVGRSGVGKSSFINAITGNEDAAEVGMLEQTNYVTAYLFKDDVSTIFWDCPGFDRDYSANADIFFERIGVAKYDRFIIMESDRLTAASVNIARKLQSIGKPFFFVRTKIDQDLFNEKRVSNHKFDEARLFQIIKSNCSGNLKGVDEKDIFLISNFHPNKWDFPGLRNAIRTRHCSRRRERFLFLMLKLSTKRLKIQIKLLKGRIRFLSFIWTLRTLFSFNSWRNSKDKFIAGKCEFYRHIIGFPDLESAEFQGMPADRKEVVEKFYLKMRSERVDPFDSGESRESDFSVPSDNTVSHLLHSVLNEMEKIALEILNDTVAQSEASHIHD